MTEQATRSTPSASPRPVRARAASEPAANLGAVRIPVNSYPQRGATPARWIAGLALATLAIPCGVHAAATPGSPTRVRVELTEWKVTLTPATVPAGPVTFEVVNRGSIPHGFEIEGRGIERSVENLAPGATRTLPVRLAAGRYEAYCPVGGDSHKMLGMETHLQVGGTARAARGGAPAATAVAGEREPMGDGDEYQHGGMTMDDDDRTGPAVRTMRATGGGPVVQILPGPFPFPDKVQAIIASRPADQQQDLMKKVHEGPYSNNVARIAGTFSVLAIDRGASGDSVSGTSEFTTADGARWRLVMDRVQTRDIPFNPRFGGVIMGLYYHGATNVHTPLVPTIRSSLALWAVGHLYRNDQLATDNAMVHVMLLSRTRRDQDFALACWDCSQNPVEELQLQITTPPGTPPLETPGGALFVNWERSTGTTLP